MSTPRFLITGASGFIGYHLYARLGPKQAVAVYHHKPVPGGVYFDAATMHLADGVLRDYPDITHAFLLHGIGRLDECARDPAGTARVNVDGMQRMINELTAHGIKVVFTSSDAVFDGTRGAWTEDDAPHPILTYGKQKVAVEKHLMGKPPPWIIARLSKVVGLDAGDHSLFGEWMRRIYAREPIRCAHDLIFAPIHVADAVTALIGLAEGNFSGIYNVCGPRSMSRLELLNIFLARLRELRPVEVEVIRCSIADFPALETRPKNGSMIADKLFSALGWQSEDMDAVCRRVALEIFGTQANLPAA